MYEKIIINDKYAAYILFPDKDTYHLILFISGVKSVLLKN